MLKLFVAIVFVLGCVSGEVEDCAADVKAACYQKRMPLEELRSMDTCNSNYGGFSNMEFRMIEQDTQSLISQHLQASMQYLLFASRFNEWKMDRKGFNAFYSKMSDDAFNEAVALLQHMNLRGGRLDSEFKVPMPEHEKYSISEMESLSRVLALEKGLVKNSLLLINSATITKTTPHETDGELAFYLAEQISGNHAPRVKTLAAHVNNLGQVIAHGLEKNSDPAYVVYLYDTQFMQ